MKIPIKKDPVPCCFVGPRTIKCTVCNWEGCWIIPEETDAMLCSILEHIQQHGISIPQFLITTY